jgi:hypothetical protein
MHHTLFKKGSTVQMYKNGPYSNKGEPAKWSGAEIICDRRPIMLMIFIERDLIPKEDKGAYNHV